MMMAAVTGIYYFLAAIEYAILFRAILSWFIDPFSPFMGFLAQITEPFIAPVRALINRFFGKPRMYDFAPLVTMVLLTLLRNMFVGMLF